MRKMDLTLVRNQEVFVGIDVSKRRYAVAVRSGGRVISRTVVPAMYAHLQALWRSLPGCRIHAVYEAGFSGFGLHDQMTADGIDACVTPPSKMARSGDRVKTDRLDAEKLARELERGALRRCRVLRPAQREAREWSRYLNQLVAQQTRLKNQGQCSGQHCSHVQVAPNWGHYSLIRYMRVRPTEAQGQHHPNPQVQALAACRRKQVTMLNAVVKGGTPWWRNAP
jgi:hypothetical protein